MTPGSRSMWLKPRLLLAVFLVFSAGAVVGALAMRLSLRSASNPPAAYYTINGKEVALQQLVKDLDLNTAQAQQLETVLDDFVMYVQMLQSQMDEVRASGKARILNILDEKQKVKFEKMMGDLQARRQ
jgi:Spy/CpxP family protein refolding chaperone